METKTEEEYQIEKIEESTENYKDAYKSKNPKFFKLGNWLKKESTLLKNETIDTIEKYPSFKRREIIKVDFGVNVGSELSNIHFAIVLNDDDKETVDNITVIPLTSKSGYWRVYLGKLKVSNNPRYNKNSYALITQITTISKSKVIPSSKKFYCNQELMDIIDSKIVEYLIK